MLKELSQNLNGFTDKSCTHSYIDLYNRLLFNIKDTALNVLEIGIGNWNDSVNGASILLWLKYFKQSNIYAIDIISQKYMINDIKNNDRIKIFSETNAYDNTFVNKNLSSIKFDMILDDGSHRLEHQLEFIKLYSPLLADNGILIIEDVQNISHFNDLIDETPDDLKKYIKTYDLRHKKARNDDLVFTIDKIN
jgi:cephalosporin hydroxylase